MLTVLTLALVLTLIILDERRYATSLGIPVITTTRRVNLQAPINHVDGLGGLAFTPIIQNESRSLRQHRQHRLHNVVYSQTPVRTA